MRKINVTLVEGETGQIVAHDLNCLVVNLHRTTGRMICTMYEVDPVHLARVCPCHTCLSITPAKDQGASVH